MLSLVSILLFIYTYLSSGGQIPNYVSEEPADLMNAVNHMSLVPETLGDQCPEHPYQGGFHEYQVPDYDTHGHVVTPQRYPQVSGGNISLVMHKGWDAMMRPGPNDYDWAQECPADQRTIIGTQSVSYSL